MKIHPQLKVFMVLGMDMLYIMINRYANHVCYTFPCRVGGSGQPLGATLLVRKLGEAAQTLTKTSGVMFWDH